jgi:23S rRNA (adenine2030-N6)-methyltransferase
MNYRHAFHAGNFADCVKHALLVALLRGLTRKPAPFFVLETHAGAGHYDLASEAALRGNEAAGGIMRLLDRSCGTRAAVDRTSARDVAFAAADPALGATVERARSGDTASAGPDPATRAATVDRTPTDDAAFAAAEPVVAAVVDCTHARDTASAAPDPAVRVPVDRAPAGNVATVMPSADLAASVNRPPACDTAFTAPDPALAEYLSLVDRSGLYPGSPELIRALLRPDDRLACCELHPDEHTALRRWFRDDRQVAVHRRDGWEALKALLPPVQKRGLVFIDPPYENPDEFRHLADGLALARSRFPTGVLAAWYPIKHRAPVRAFFAGLRPRDVIAAELLLRAPLDPARLNGCGLLVVNPPYQFEQVAETILRALLPLLGNGEAGEAATVTRLADE